MKKVYQTRFGGLDAPLAEQGNCFQACVASILEIPLKDAFDCIPFETEHRPDLFEEQLWFLEFNKWLAKFELACIYIECKPRSPAMTPIKGYHIAEVKSKVLKGCQHVLVMKEGRFVHDPNPNLNSQYDSDDVLGIYLLMPMDVALLIDKKKVKDD